MKFDEAVIVASVYEFRNTQNGKRYVGSSVHSHARWNRHIRELEQKKHGNPKLQNAWDKYGSEAFIFKTLETPENATEELLRSLEQNFLPDAVATGYNLSLEATAPMGGRKHSKATRDKMARSHTGLKNTPETNKKIGEANSQRIWTPAMRAVRAEIGRRRQGKKYGPVSEQARQNVAAAAKKRGGPKPGWRMSEAGRENCRRAALRRGAKAGAE